MLITPGCMDASDNFDFLFGVNYWDAVFKGAIDEVYIFDQALTAGQALTLYHKGDANAAFEEPERVVEVVATIDDPAMTVGSTALDNGFWTSFTDGFEIKDGEAKQITLQNYSDGVNTWDNYVLVFTNTQTTNDLVPSAENYEGYAEYCVARADVGVDGYCWFNNADLSTNSHSWANWDTWRTKVSVDMDVVIVIKRDGNTFTINTTYTDFNGTENTSSQTLVSDTLTADAPCYFFFTGEMCYVEVYSIEDAIEIVKNPDALETFGYDTYVDTWWGAGDFTNGYELVDGVAKTFVVQNYGGANNYNNLLYVFTNVQTYADPIPSADNYADYAEYAVIRSDYWGWGYQDGTVLTKSWDDEEWAEWLKSMKDALITTTITRDGNMIYLRAVAECYNGNVYNYDVDIVTTMDASSSCYVAFLTEGAYDELLSVE